MGWLCDLAAMSQLVRLLRSLLETLFKWHMSLYSRRIRLIWLPDLVLRGRGSVSWTISLRLSRLAMAAAARVVAFSTGPWRFGARSLGAAVGSEGHGVFFFAFRRIVVDYRFMCCRGLGAGCHSPERVNLKNAMAGKLPYRRSPHFESGACMVGFGGQAELATHSCLIPEAQRGTEGSGSSCTPS